MPSRVVTYVGTQGFNQSADDCRPLAVKQIPVINGILHNKLMVMTGRVNGDGHILEIKNLTLGNPVTHCVDPFRIMDNFFREDKRHLEAVHDLPHLTPQFWIMK